MGNLARLFFDQNTIAQTVLLYRFYPLISILDPT